MKKTKSQLFIQALKQKVVPATGCTEPVAVALAAATSAKYLTNKDSIDHVKVSVSLNIYKNAMAVIVPGTGEPGLKIATAAGLISGDPTLGLKVISKITPEQVKQIKKFAETDKVEVELAHVPNDLFVQVAITSGSDVVTTTIVDDHTNIVKITKNQQVILENTQTKTSAEFDLNQWLRQQSLQAIWDFALTEPLENISFIKKAADLNMALAQEGLHDVYGLESGSKLRQGIGDDTIDHELLIFSQAASDARMGGAMLPAMSNSGSGNQGITATVPVVIVARRQKKDQEQLIRALALSHLTAIYIHAFLPVLSAFCAADSAAMGSAVAACYLLDQDLTTAENAVKNMVEDATGMVCDGAGCACALKVGSAVSSMYRSVMLAVNGVKVPASNGLVSDDIDQTIKNIGQLAHKGMKQTDPEILNIMVNK